MIEASKFEPWSQDMFFEYSDAAPVQVMPGLERRTLAEGGEMMTCEFILEEGVEIPCHSHPQEQLGYVVSGKLIVTVGDNSAELSAGDCYFAPGGVSHGAMVLEKARVVDTFSPPREDYR
jgi:quercetin dioxygenase-like cupin family protein